MAECSFITDREAKFLAAVLAALIIIPVLWMAHDVLTAPQTMIPVLIGVPLIAAIIWYGWGRTSPNWGAFALFLAGALALPVGAAFWTAFALVILRQIVIQRQKKGVMPAS